MERGTGARRTVPRGGTGSMEHVQAVRRAVEAHLDEQMADLERFVNTDSGTSDKIGVDRVGALVRERLESIGCSVRTYPQSELGDHVLGELRGAGGPNILIVSHMDTV